MKRKLNLEDVVDEQVLKASRRFRPKVVIVDIDLPSGSGLELVSKLVRSDCQPKVIIITDESEPNVLNLQIETGATGFLTKECTVDDILSAVKAAAKNQIYTSEKFSRLVTLGKIGGTGNQPLKGLSRRELDVLVMLAKGRSHQEIAKLLTISPKTVSTYKSRIHQKLNTRNTADITRFAVQYGLLTKS